MSIRPSLDEAKAWTSPSYCGPDWANSASDRLCEELQRGQELAQGYLRDAQRLDRDQMGLRAVQLASAVALAGFNAYDAHEDNTTAALLVGGAASTLNGGLHPATSAQVELNAYRATQCIVQAARPFAGRQALQRQRLQIAHMLDSASAFSPNMTSLDAGADASVALLAGMNAQRVIARAASLRTRLRIAAGAQASAADRVRDAFDGIDAYIDNALTPTNWDQIIENLRKPPEPEPTDQTDKDAVDGIRAAGVVPAAAANDFRLAGVRATSELTAANSAASLARAAIGLDLYLDMLAEQTDGPGEDEFAAIGKCVPGV